MTAQIPTERNVKALLAKIGPEKLLRMSRLLSEMERDLNEGRQPSKDQLSKFPPLFEGLNDSEFDCVMNYFANRGKPR